MKNSFLTPVILSKEFLMLILGIDIIKRYNSLYRTFYLKQEDWCQEFPAYVFKAVFPMNERLLSWSIDRFGNTFLLRAKKHFEIYLKEKYSPNERIRNLIFIETESGNTKNPFCRIVDDGSGLSVFTEFYNDQIVIKCAFGFSDYPHIDYSCEEL